MVLKRKLVKRKPIVKRKPVGKRKLVVKRKPVVKRKLVVKRKPPVKKHKVVLVKKRKPAVKKPALKRKVTVVKKKPLVKKPKAKKALKEVKAKKADPVKRKKRSTTPRSAIPRMTADRPTGAPIFGARPDYSVTKFNDLMPNIKTGARDKNAFNTARLCGTFMLDKKIPFASGKLGEKRWKLLGKGAYGSVYRVTSAKQEVQPMFSKLTHRFGSASMPDSVIVKLQRLDAPEYIDEMKREQKMHMAIQKCMKDAPTYYFGGLYRNCEYMTVMCEIQGIPLAKYVKKQKLTRKQYDAISRTVSNNWKCGFIHCDLHDENIFFGVPKQCRSEEVTGRSTTLVQQRRALTDNPPAQTLQGTVRFLMVNTMTKLNSNNMHMF